MNFFDIFTVKSNEHDLQNGFTQEKPETQAKLVAYPQQRRQKLMGTRMVSLKTRGHQLNIPTHTTK